MLYKVLMEGDEVCMTFSENKAHYHVRKYRSFGNVELYAKISDDWILLSRHHYKPKKNLT